ncbi:MAG: phosphotransferase [Neisseriaceae bacterium]|nr:phosphotransferase [Neisseriaceae bacterium]
MERQNQLRHFIVGHYPNRPFDLDFAAADADFRRYFRARFQDDNSTIIAMDAPPDKMTIQPYLKVRDIFSAVRVPEIFISDEEQGFILMEDLGTATFLQAMQADEREEVHKVLLLEAVDTLVRLQASSQENVLPLYDEKLLRREMNLFPEWYILHELGKTLTMKQQKIWQKGMDTLIPALTEQPKVFVHRDFIVRNLMLRSGEPGVLDFQDAVYGAITYDILSLTRDAFIEWTETFVLDIIIRYWEKARATGLPVHEQFDDFYRAYEWTGIQRHFKVIGIFARLKHRDGKEKYATEIPRFIRYLHRALRRYSELSVLRELLTELCGEDTEIQTGYTF